MRGHHLIRHWSSTQSTVTLSSAEAELNGICRGASTSIGLRSVAHDLGLSWSITLKSDATAAIGITRRRGLGKIRHSATADVWVHDHLRAGGVDLKKVPGCDNVADILTKHVDRTTLQRHMKTMGLVAEQGRASSAPRLDN